jgi:hypothetical protein
MNLQHRAQLTLTLGSFLGQNVAFEGLLVLEPLAVFLKRLAAPRTVLILGITLLHAFVYRSATAGQTTKPDTCLPEETASGCCHRVAISSSGR